MSTRFAMAWPAAAKPYPGEVVQVTNAPPDLTRPWEEQVTNVAGAHGCTGRRGDGQLCNGNAGIDGRCARHKE